MLSHVSTPHRMSGLTVFFEIGKLLNGVAKHELLPVTTLQPH